MKIKTTVLFKIRRLASYTKKAVPAVSDEKRPFRFFSAAAAWRQERMEREIFSSCIILKNLARIHRDLPMSADFILEQLMECSGPLRTVYADILSAFRLGQGEEAFAILPARIPLRSAENFAAVLSSIDKINPAELTVQMTAFEEALTSERMTRAMSRAEKKSLITAMAATATVFAILLNFTVVVVFMDAMRALGQVFS